MITLNEQTKCVDEIYKAFCIEARKYVWPIFWVSEQTIIPHKYVFNGLLINLQPKGSLEHGFHNGSCFFVKGDKGLFGVTARHVIDSYRHDKEIYKSVILKIGNATIKSLEIIDESLTLDIITFRITDQNEIKAICISGRVGVASFEHTDWGSLSPLQKEDAVLVVGYPAKFRTLEENNIEFTQMPCGLVVSDSSYHESKITIEEGLRVFDSDNFDLRGSSGGPAMKPDFSKGSLELVGLLIQGQDSFFGSKTPARLVIRHINCINKDGTIKKANPYMMGGSPS